jgi:hypothetical protein
MKALLPSPKHFSVVLFSVDNSVEAVPTKWLSEDGLKCYWPKKVSTEASFRKLLENPDSSLLHTWFEFDIRCVKSYSKYLVSL